MGWTLDDDSESPNYTLDTPSVAPNDNVVAQRAIKADYGLGEQSPGTPVLSNSIQNGQEHLIRDQAANADALQLEQTKNNIIQKVAAEQGKQMSPEEVQVLMDMNRQDFKSDPQSIFEKKYAEKMTTSLLTTKVNNPSSVNRAASDAAPAASTANADAFTDLTTANEYFNTQFENLAAEYQKQDGVTTAWQYAQTFVPLLSAYRLHQALQSPTTTDLLPGNNQGQQISYLKSLPFSEAKPLFDAAIADLKSKNLLDAMTFAHNFISFANSDAVVGNVMGIADTAGVATPFLKLGAKLIGRSAGKLSDPIKAAEAASAADHIDWADVLHSAEMTHDSAGTNGVINEMAHAADVGKTKTYFLPSKIAEQVDRAHITPGEVESFKAGGAKYTPHEDMVYVTPEDAKKLDITRGNDNQRLVQTENTIARSQVGPDGQWSIPFDSQKVPFQTKPAEGLVPVELGETENKFGTNIHTDVWVHDHPITQLNRAEQDVQFSVKNNKMSRYSPTSEGGEGMTPITIADDGTAIAGQPIRGSMYYLSQPEARSFFGHGNQPTSLMAGPAHPTTAVPGRIVAGRDGPEFFTDWNNKVSSVPSKTPFPGAFPVMVSKDGKYVNPYYSRIAEQAVKDQKVAMKDVATTMGTPELDVPSVLTAMGRTEQAGIVDATKVLSTRAAGKVADPVETLPSAFNPRNFFGKGKGLSRAFRDEIINRFESQTQNVMNLLGKLHVPRGTPDAITQGLQEAEASLRAEYGGRLADSIIDVLKVPPELNPNKANLDTAVLRIGTPQRLPFDSRAAAEQAFHQYGFIPGEAEVKQFGGNFYIAVARHVDEESQAFREALVVPSNQTPRSIWNTMLWRFRTTEDLLSGVQRDARHIATHAPQVLNRVLKEQIEGTRSLLSRAERKEVSTFLEYERDATSKTNPLARGIQHDTQGDFEQSFLSRMGKLPSEGQIAHYYNYHRVSDLDWYLRNLGMYRDKGRLGIEQWAFGDTPFFEGKVLKDGIPWGGQDAGIWVQASGSKNGTFVSKHTLSRGEGGTGMSKEDINKLIKDQDWKVVQLAFPVNRPLKDVLKDDRQIHFIVTNDFKRKALDFNQLPYNPGVHSIYRDPWYVAQPVIQKGTAGKMHYYGDHNLMNFVSEAQATKYAQAFDKARELYRSNDPSFGTHLSTNLPYTRDQWDKMIARGHIDLENPIVVRQEGANTIDNNTWIKNRHPDLVDGTKSEYNLEAQMDKAFQADRDLILDSVNEKGSVYQIGGARQFDPYTAMNRALNQSVRNLWMNDYKISAVQSWLEEFASAMTPNYKTVSNSPMYFLYNPQWNKNADKAMLAAGEANRRAVLNFVSAQSEIAGSVTYLQNKLISSIYNKLGQKASEITADHMLPAIKDPAKYIRAIAFHTKLGMFNPVQAFVQAQSMAHVLALGGKEAPAGFAGAFMARRLLHNDDPAVLDAMTKIATKMGWKADDFKEMVQAIKSNGIGEVAGETAMRDDIFDQKLFASTVGKWLDKGTMFFAEGERTVRLSAFATSYREWKAANPMATLSNRAMGAIMTRADTLSLNMTRASAAAWQNGLTSIPLQFTAFAARFAEQMAPFIGKRLSTAEKARAWATYSALYGVPVTAAGVTAVWPYYDDIKMEAMRRGIDLSPKYIEAMMEGIPEMALHALSGHGYNVGTRFGPNGTSVFRDMIRQEKSFLSVMGGPSASIIGDIWESADPVGRYIASAFHGNPEQFPLKATDGMNVLNNINTANLVTRSLGAYTYGKYISKGGVTVGPMDNMDTAMSVLGLTPTHIADTYLKQQAMKGDAKGQKPFEREVLKNFGLAIQAGAANDEQGFKDYMTRVSRYVELGDFNFEDRQRLYHEALQFRPDLQEKVNWDFVRRSPDSQYINRFNSFFTIPKAQ